MYLWQCKCLMQNIWRYDYNRSVIFLSTSNGVAQVCCQKDLCLGNMLLRRRGQIYVEFGDISHCRLLKNLVHITYEERSPVRGRRYVMDVSSITPLTAASHHFIAIVVYGSFNVMTVAAPAPVGARPIIVCRLSTIIDALTAGVHKRCCIYYYSWCMLVM